MLFLCIFVKNKEKNKEKNMAKGVRSLSKEEAKVGFKGKTITLKSTDDNDKRMEINKKFIDGKISLLYVNDVNDVTNFVYEVLK